MSVDRMVLAFAGCVVLLGVALAHFVNPWWIVPVDLRRSQHDPGRLHRLLPGGHGVQEAGRQARRRFPVTAAARRSRPWAFGRDLPSGYGDARCRSPRRSRWPRSQIRPWRNPRRRRMRPIARLSEARAGRLPTVVLSGQSGWGTTDLGGFFGFGRSNVSPAGRGAGGAPAAVRRRRDQRGDRSRPRRPRRGAGPGRRGQGHVVGPGRRGLRHRAERRPVAVPQRGPGPTAERDRPAGGS